MNSSRFGAEANPVEKASGTNALAVDLEYIKHMVEELKKTGSVEYGHGLKLVGRFDYRVKAFVEGLPELVLNLVAIIEDMRRHGI